MKKKTAALLSVAWLACVPASYSMPEFCAVFDVAGDRLFLLADNSSLKNSPWIRVGGTFAGYTIIAFDEKAEALLLKNPNGLIKLGLRLTVPAEPPPRDKQSPASVAIIVTKGGNLLFENRPVEIPALYHYLATLAINSPNAALDIRVLNDVDLTELEKTLGKLREIIASAGFDSTKSTVSLSTKM